MWQIYGGNEKHCTEHAMSAATRRRTPICRTEKQGGFRPAFCMPNPPGSAGGSAYKKTPKPVWFRGFLNRYLFRFALLARRTEKDIYLILAYNISKKAEFSSTILLGRINVKKSLHFKRHKPKADFLRRMDSYSNSKSV